MDRDWLIKHYLILNKSPNQIEKEFKIGHTTITRWLEKFNIKKRTIQDVHNIKIDKYRNKSWLIEEYIKKKKTIKQISEKCNAKYETIRKWLVKHDIPRRKNYTRKKPRLKCINCGEECKKFKKIYCSRDCFIKYRYNNYIKQWKQGIKSGRRGKYATSLHIKKYMILKYGEKCNKCGWNERNIITNNIPIELHHKDGNYKNNKEENLKLLCPSCHSLTQTYGSLNKNGRNRH